ncbi:MAG: hypothetical protein AAF648_09265 [Pseudomonadota bacterium]
MKAIVSRARLGSTLLITVLALPALSFGEADYDAAESSDTPGPARSEITLGNGKRNWIITDGVTRDGGTLTFKEVTIDGNGWLVIHPFEDGKPNGDKYVGASYLKDGRNKDVDIMVHKGLSSGEMFIVMLHRDLNENQVLDFVFVDDRNVMDRAVFEGSRMIAHAMPAP